MVDRPFRAITLLGLLGFTTICRSHLFCLIFFPIRWTIRIYLPLGGLFSISKTFFLFYHYLRHLLFWIKRYGLPNQAPQVLKETYSGHEDWFIRHPFEEKVQHLPCSAMFTRGLMCLFRLKIVGGESGTKCLFTQPPYLRNRNVIGR